MLPTMNRPNYICYNKSNCLDSNNPQVNCCGGALFSWVHVSIKHPSYFTCSLGGIMLAILHSHGILTEIFVSKRVRFLSKTAHLNVTLVGELIFSAAKLLDFFSKSQ